QSPRPCCTHSRLHEGAILVVGDNESGGAGPAASAGVCIAGRTSCISWPFTPCTQCIPPDTQNNPVNVVIWVTENLGFGRLSTLNSVGMKPYDSTKVKYLRSAVAQDF